MPNPGEEAAYANGYQAALDDVQLRARVCKIIEGEPILATLDRLVENLRKERSNAD